MFSLTLKLLIILFMCSILLSQEIETPVPSNTSDAIPTDVSPTNVSPTDISPTDVSPTNSSASGLTLPSLCDDVNIHAVDRLPNNTYRVYRGDYYWELKDLPSRVAQVKGPYPLPFQNMDTFTKGYSIMTIIPSTQPGGHVIQFSPANVNKHFQLSGKYYGYTNFHVTSNETTFQSIFCDGDLDNKGFPFIIGFRDDVIHYWKVDKDKEKMYWVQKDKKLHPHGLFDENFPFNLTTAVAFPSNDSKVLYYVYLFRGDKYCYRPINNVTAEDGCPEWRENRELFGCPITSTESPVGETTGNESISKDPDSIGKSPTDFSPSGLTTSSSPTDSGSGGGSSWLWIIIILVILFVIIAIVVIVCLLSSKKETPKESSGAPPPGPPPPAAAPSAAAGASPEDPDPGLNTPSTRSELE